MNKAEFITKMHEHNEKETIKAQTERAFDAFVAVLKESLAEGQTVTITGLGSFSVTQRAARQGRNPRTGVSIAIPASKGIKFKPGKALKDAIAVS